jgi:hypothetical protein
MRFSPQLGRNGAHFTEYSPPIQSAVADIPRTVFS